MHRDVYKSQVTTGLDAGWTYDAICCFDSLDPDVLYICYRSKHCIYRYELSTGNYELYAGAREDPGYEDGKRLNARFNFPSQICFDLDGIMYIADSSNPVSYTHLSYYIENLTISIAQQAWNLFLSVEEAGGFYVALKAGTVQAAVNESNKARHKAVAQRREVLLGTNQFPNFNEKAGDKQPVEAKCCCCLLYTSVCATGEDCQGKGTNAGNRK